MLLLTLTILQCVVKQLENQLRFSTGNQRTVEDRAKATISGLYKIHVVHGLSTVAKTYDLDDLCARFKVIDSLNGAMTKYSLVMTPTPCMLETLSLFDLRINAPVHLLTYTE